MVVTTDADFKELATKFAEDKKAYHEALGNAFLKMINLGYEEENLDDITTILNNHPLKNFIGIYY